MEERDENWIPCYGAEQYEANTNGDVRNAKTGRILSQYTDVNGRKTVTVRVDGKTYKRSVHRMIAEAVHGDECNNMDIYHLDGDKQNNRIDNLAIGTRSDTIKNKCKNKCRRILVVETGEIFDTLSDCSKAVGMSKSAISKSLNFSFCSNRKGLHFKLVD